MFAGSMGENFGVKLGIAAWQPRPFWQSPHRRWQWCLQRKRHRRLRSCHNRRLHGNVRVKLGDVAVEDGGEGSIELIEFPAKGRAAVSEAIGWGQSGGLAASMASIWGQALRP